MYDLEVRISSEGYVDVPVGSNGQRKRISIKDFSKSVAALVDEADQNLVQDTIILPKSIYTLSKSNQGYVLTMYYKGEIRTVTHTSAGTHNIPLPNVVIKLNLDKKLGTIDQYNISNLVWFATSLNRDELPADIPSSPSPGSRFWALPMPNMYSSASMCTGSNVLPRNLDNNWRVLEDLYENVLVRSKFNNDLNVPSLRERQNPGEWIKTLADLVIEDEDAQFPYHMLVSF